MIQLSGITWDHPRGYEPLIGTSAEFSRVNPEISITWKKRSLKDFGDFPIEELSEKFDLILLDHPFMGTAHQKNILVPINESIPAALLKPIQESSLGLCYESYSYGGNQYALPVDAAALVSVGCGSEFPSSFPKTFDDIFQWASSSQGQRQIILPLCPTDIWCLFLSFCAQIGGRSFFDFEKGFPLALGEESIVMIYRLISIADLASLKLNPISLMEKIIKDHKNFYCPYTFGYISYSQREMLIFADAPKITHAKASTVLGGVGIGVSAKSLHIFEALQYVLFVASPNIQETLYASCGGQPSQINAWLSEKLNQSCHNFFSNTISTLQEAYMRPRLPEWNAFQECAAEILHEGICLNSREALIVERINNAFQTIIQQGENHG